MVDVPRALTQIAEIHQQIAKGEIYRGYKSVPIAASAAVGIAAAALQPRLVDGADPVAFVEYWTVVAVFAGLVGISEIAYNYVVHEQASGRRRTRRVLGQFLPGVLGAAMLTASFVHVDPRLVALLPGVWAICFGIGTFSSRPYLPRASGVVALFYFAVGSALLWTADLASPNNGWRVGGTFGVGQLLAAIVLYWELERTES
jgi:TctA family transporter